MADDKDTYCFPDDPDLCAAEDELRAAVAANEPPDLDWFNSLPEDNTDFSSPDRTHVTFFSKKDSQPKANGHADRDAGIATTDRTPHAT